MSSSHKNNGFGKDFERAWTEGMENQNWTYLNDVIVKSVDDFLDNVGDKMNEALGNKTSATPLSARKEDFSGKTQTAKLQRELHAERQRVRAQMERERIERERERRERRVAKRNTPPATELAFPFKNTGAASAVAYCVVGGIGVGITAVSTIVGGLTGLLAGTATLGSGFVLSIGFLGLFSALLGKGIGQQKMSSLAARYVQIIGKRQYIDISTLALSLNKTERRVVREIKKLLKQGFFPQGHLDRNYRTFILTDEVFNHYLELETSGSTPGIIDTTARSEDEQEFPTLTPEESAELSRMIREGNGYITRIRELNNEIPGIEISAKLDRLEGLLKEIFIRVKEHPEQMSRIHELMDYYLPTAVKLVDAYKEYDRVSEPGKEILSAKTDIENTLDTINSALGKLLNKLFKDSVLDVTTDAQVLKTVLVQKGLTNGNDDISKGDKK